ncbi:hypothetical protein BD626DRAFT_510939 [Schizophyllum amplum]|uniref:Uncharacterized protein n=1 Tax=Schizophyllum amplum TaxID=97359 RepID=A0A550C1H4_9AGAR|nr:hypothetical protein BD626DRAFT_510939 [Auriculariopsis ampla]
MSYLSTPPSDLPGTPTTVASTLTNFDPYCALATPASMPGMQPPPLSRHLLAQYHRRPLLKALHNVRTRARSVDPTGIRPK